jgi:hypothetical protein
MFSLPAVRGLAEWLGGHHSHDRPEVATVCPGHEDRLGEMHMCGAFFPTRFYLCSFFFADPRLRELPSCPCKIHGIVTHWAIEAYDFEPRLEVLVRSGVCTRDQACAGVLDIAAVLIFFLLGCGIPVYDSEV